MKGHRFLKLLSVVFLFMTVVAYPWQPAMAVTNIDDEDMWTKLGRGGTNIVTGWMEVFNQPKVMAETKRWPIAILGGVPKGVFYAVMRTAVGVYETLTFFAPIPEGYRVILHPEHVIPD